MPHMAYGVFVRLFHVSCRCGPQGTVVDSRVCELRRGELEKHLVLLIV